MNQKALDRICEVLDSYFPTPPVPLNHTCEFTFLVAIILSAQTTDGKVNQVTAELFRHAPTPQAMAKLSFSFVQKIIQSVGLAPKKSEYLVNMSKMLLEEYNGKVPSTMEELQSLPGVGRKTASVIMSQAFGVPSFAVDTHVHRLALRWGLTKEPRNPDKVQQDLCNLFPRECWNKMHLQMIYFGREYCTAKDHKPSECPICSWVVKKESQVKETTCTKLESSVGSKKRKATKANSIPSSPPEQLAASPFSPKKKVKNIVYYADRMNELQQSPSLVKYDSHSPLSTNLLQNKLAAGGNKKGRKLKEKK